MRSLRKTLLTAIVFLGSFSSYAAASQDPLSFRPLEHRLQQLISSNQEETERLHELFDLYWDWSMAENPDDASFLGYPGRYGDWPDFSPEAIDRRSNFRARFLDVLASIQSNHLLAKEDQVSYNILKRMLEDEQLESQFGSQYLLLNQMQGIHLYTAMIIELMPAKTVEDYENILSRLRKLPEVFQQITQLLEHGIEVGITPPRITLQHVPQQILNQMTDQPRNSPYLIAFNQFPPSIDSTTQNRLLNEAETVYQQKIIPTFSQFYSYVTERYIPHCRKTIAFSDLPHGEEWYAHKVHSSTTTLLSPQEIHTIGLKEIARIQEEMRLILASTGFQGSFEQFLHFLKTDPQFFYPNRDELLKGYQTLTRYIESKLPLLFKQLPILPYEVVPVPSYSEESQVAAYYRCGSLSDNRPGSFFINTSFPEQRPKWEMEPLALHEAVPGHHLQISLAQELQNLPEFRKHIHFTAYIEGWGLYAESLGLDLGVYQDPYSKFGRLTYEMLRAIRLVVDTGMHALGWSRDQAIDFFKQHVGMSDHEIITEVDRYLVVPSQALAYKIGELKLQEMRLWATQTLGDRFDIRDFHQAWLEHGTVPLDIAEQQIYEWVEHHSPSFIPENEGQEALTL